MDSRLLDVSATESVRAIREGRVSCEAVVDAHLSRLEEVHCAAAPWRDDIALAAAIAIEMRPDDRPVSG